MAHNLMLFAAGRGTRMGALTKHVPKPLIEVAGRPLIDHALETCNTAKVGQIVVNVHHQADQVRRHLSGRNILISDETDALLETGGGLRRALPLLGREPVYTLNSDAVWCGENPLESLRANWRPDDMHAVLLLLPAPEARAHGGPGDFDMDDHGRLRRGTKYVYLGAQILRTDGLMTIKEPAFSLNLLWDQMIASGKLYGLEYQGGWCDVGTPAGIEAAEALLGQDF